MNIEGGKVDPFTFGERVAQQIDPVVFVRLWLQGLCDGENLVYTLENPYQEQAAQRARQYASLLLDALDQLRSQVEHDARSE